MKGIVIVAHPDDESMFCGGTVAKLKWDWMIVSAVHKVESQRGHEFLDACRVLGAKPIMLDVEYHGKKSNHPIDANELKDKLITAVSLDQYDLVITHNEEGEYNNQDHIVVHKIVEQLVNGNIWYFGFNRTDADLIIRLNKTAQETKKRALEKYNSQQDRITIFEVRGEETFITNW